ncbi:MAG: beta-N-acetylhexosaminidase [Ferruginibacter sp.]
MDKKASVSRNPGQCLLPVPQKISLLEKQYLLDDSWAIEPGPLSKDDPAMLSLVSELKARFGLRIMSSGNSHNKSIRLSVQPGSVIIGKTIDTNRSALKKQAYRLKLEPGRISINANGAQGLFYGVQTLLQLLQPVNGNTYYTGGEIVDWPVMGLRMIYWDDAHHLERLDAMKRAIRQASYYKINAFSLKLEGHFQFAGAKPIVEPYAYTPAEFQELTDYAKARYIELVPYLDAPAHISFILKHPEYAGLRSFPNSNYELDVTNPKADELISGMLDELIAANKGGKYIFLSTDEAYYIGKAESEKKRALELGGNGRLLAEYITRISNKLHKKGRKVIIWGEYPLLPEDITSLPSHLVNGINGNSEEYGSKFKEHGIRHLAFTSTQGEEPLFPNYYKLPVKKSPPGNSLLITREAIQQADMSAGRVSEVVSTITGSIKAGRSDFMGVVVCGWADAGLNPETFWLGYATGNAAAWNLDSVNIEDLANRFYFSFYGNKQVDMNKVYQSLSVQAGFWTNSWEWQPANNRTPIFGYSAGIYDVPRQAKDQTLPFVPVPSSLNLSLSEDWNIKNKERLDAAEKLLEDNNELLMLLQKNLASVDYQQYNLQVLLSVARLCRHNLTMLLDLKRINEFLDLSSRAAGTNPALAVSLLDEALDQVKRIRDDRNEVLRTVISIWYQDWYPRVPEANDRKYVDKVDDVKDHPPVRTVDMSYLAYRELKYPLGKWAAEVGRARNEFAQRNNLPAKTAILDWQSINN